MTSVVRDPVRITAVLTHPVQYMAPWFRSIAANRPDIELTVLYGAIPSAEQQGVGFDRAFTWDVPVTDGYRFTVCGDAAGRRFDSDAFFGLDVRDIRHRIEDTAPDVVLLAGWHSAMQVRALRECRRAGIPVLYRGDSTLFSGRRGFARPAWELKTRYFLRQFSGYLSVGHHATEYLRHFGVPEARIARSPHCVDNGAFAAAAARERSVERRPQHRGAIGATDDDFVVLFAGKFQERKRPLDAVRAVAALGPGAVLVMAGDGPLAASARDEAARLGVRLAWRGFLNQSQLPVAFAAADCVLVPSAWESWGLIVNEALASGVPCVVTDGVAAAPDLIVDGRTGYVVPAGDVAAAAARLRDVHRAQQHGEDFAAACQQMAATCSIEAATNGLALAARRAVAGTSRVGGRAIGA